MNLCERIMRKRKHGQNYSSEIPLILCPHNVRNWLVENIIRGFKTCVQAYFWYLLGGSLVMVSDALVEMSCGLHRWIMHIIQWFLSSHCVSAIWRLIHCIYAIIISAERWRLCFHLCWFLDNRKISPGNRNPSSRTVPFIRVHLICLFTLFNVKLPLHICFQW